MRLFAPLPEGCRLSQPTTLISVGFGTGLLRGAPGTWGSLAALPPAMAIVWLGGWPALAVAAVVVSVLGIWAADAMVRRSGVHDPGIIVVDEIAGQWITILPIAAHFEMYPLAFVAFRIADIAKPWPVSVADRRVGGGFGVMLDDVIAALYAAVAVWLIGGWLASGEWPLG